MTALPETVTKVLNEFLEAAKKASGTRLEAAVLFGSAAEGRLRPCLGRESDPGAVFL